MRFSLFYELQLPRPWNEDSEHRLIDEALEQIRLADKLGFHCVWAPEHHFLEEYAHSSASAVWLAAAAAQTEKIRIGLGIMPLPAAFQHPARVAETAATLDLISHGRVELGTGETSSDMELGGFHVNRDTKRAQWEESLDVVARMMVEEPFTGHSGQYLEIPARNVIPKPRQKPHPPLWVACSQRETIRVAAKRGLGALSFSFAVPDEAKRWVDEYYELIASDECAPAGHVVNPNFALALPLHVNTDSRLARARGGPGARFFGYALAHYYAFGEHKPGVTDIYADFKAAGSRGDLNSGDATSAIGTPDEVTDLIRAYENAGVDELLFAVQVGATKHEHILESLELFAKEVMPEFEERRPGIEQKKAERLAGAISKPKGRQAAPRKPADEEAPVVTLTYQALKKDATRGAELGLQRLVARSSDERIEQIAGSSLGLKAMFKALESRYVPANAQGFTGQIQYDLKYEDGRTTSWSLALDSRRAKATNAPAVDPALTISATIADFVRMGTGDLAPAKALLTGRIDIAGDLVIAARLGEMFGQASPF